MQQLSRDLQWATTTRQREEDNTPGKRDAMAHAFGRFVAEVASITFPCTVDTHVGNRSLTCAPFHVIACEDGVPDTTQQLIDADAQRAACSRLLSHLRDYIVSMDALEQILQFRQGAYDTINLHIIFGDIRKDFDCFGYYNASRISELFGQVSMQSRVHAGGMCFDLERLTKSIATSFVNTLEDAIRTSFELHSPQVSFSSFQNDQYLKQQLVDHIAAHVSMAWKTRSALCGSGFDRLTLDVEFLQSLCDSQIDQEARVIAERERNADAQRIGRLRDLVRFCSTVQVELLRLLLSQHRQQIIHLLENPPAIFKKNSVAGQNFQWNGLLQILVVHQADDLLVMHVFRWGRTVFVNETVTDALSQALDRIIASIHAQRVSTSGFLPTVARLIQQRGHSPVPLPAWCRLPVGTEQAKLTRELQDLLRSGVFSSMGSGGQDAALSMPPDTERRMRLVSAVLELAANEKTAKIFFSPGVFLAEYIRRVVVMQRETAHFATGLVNTVLASSQLGQNFLQTQRKIVNFRGTGLENRIRRAGLQLSDFSAREIFAASERMDDAFSRRVFQVARDHMVQKCPEQFYSLVPRCLNAFLAPFLKLRVNSGVPNLRPSSVLEDSLRSIPCLASWISETGGFSAMRGKELSITIPEAKNGVEGTYDLLLHLSKNRAGLVAKKRVKSKQIFVINGTDLAQKLQGGSPLDDDDGSSRIVEVHPPTEAPGWAAPGRAADKQSPAAEG